MTDRLQREQDVRDACGPLGVTTVAAVRSWFRYSGGRRAFAQFANGWQPPQKRDPYKARARAEYAMSRYINDGWTLDRIGDDLGITREMVRQEFVRYLPFLYQWARRHRRERSRFLASEALPVRPCFVCGVDMNRTDDLAPSRRRFCSNEHYYAWTVIRYQISGEDGKNEHRRCVHSWLDRHPEYEDTSRQYIENARNGTVASRGRWINHGSRAEKVATEAYLKGWPVFGLLDPAVQRQIIERLDPQSRKRKPRRGIEVDARRELVAAGKAEGMTSKQIAELLDVPVHIVQNDVRWLHYGHA